MKKILLSSLCLIILACSILIFQMSCQKEAIADTENSLNITQQNKIVYTIRIHENREIYIVNYDGSNQEKININIPGYHISNEGVKISPDNKFIFFIASSVNTCDNSIFKCNIDGSNPTKVIEGTGLGCESIKGLDVY